MRVELETGEVEVLLTDLVDSQKYPEEDFKALYHERWTVEEGIKTAKCKIEVENWTRKTVHSVYQDFHAPSALSEHNMAVSFLPPPVNRCWSGRKLAVGIATRSR